MGKYDLFATPVNDLERIGNYLRKKMGVATTAQEMSVATTAGIVHFGMIGYSTKDSLLIVISPDNPVLEKSAVDRLLQRVELVTVLSENSTRRI